MKSLLRLNRRTKIAPPLFLFSCLPLAAAPIRAADANPVAWHKHIRESEAVRAQRMAFAQSELYTLLDPFSAKLAKATWKIAPGMEPFSFVYSRRDEVWNFRAPSAQGPVQAALNQVRKGLKPIIQWF